MRKTLLLAVSLSLALSACLPTFLQPPANPTPFVNVEATAAALGATIAAQTVQALPTPTLVPSDTPVFVVAASTETPTQVPTLPATASVLATDLTVLPTGTGAACTPCAPTSTPVSGARTATPTLGVLLYGTLPPLVPSGRVVMMNKSHAQAYVSFQCINKENTLSILEYPVSRWMEVKIPSGKCNYVAWVGGRELVGSFSLDTGGERRLIFYIDRIQIK